MSNHDLLDRSAPPATTEHDPETAAFVEFLASEFPAWEVEVDATETWSGDVHPLWTATREGHHPQSALTAGKLHRRLSDYEAREGARHAGSN